MYEITKVAEIATPSKAGLNFDILFCYEKFVMQQSGSNLKESLLSARIDRTFRNFLDSLLVGAGDNEIGKVLHHCLHFGIFENFNVCNCLLNILLGNI